MILFKLNNSIFSIAKDDVLFQRRYSRIINDDELMTTYQVRSWKTLYHITYMTYTIAITAGSLCGTTAVQVTA